MSRSGYTDECDDNWQQICWRGAVKAAIKGKRGQAFLRELAAAMDAMPDKRLTEGALEADGEVCALGAIGRARGIELSKLDIDWDAWDWAPLAQAFGISEALAREIMYHNDEYSISWWQKKERDKDHGPARWKYMRKWIDEQLAVAPSQA